MERGMEADNQEKERRNSRFAQEELGELLRLFTSLGLTVALGITGFFLLGRYLEGRIASLGVPAAGFGKIAGLLLGLFLSLFWSYTRIVRHLDKYAARPKNDPPASDRSKKDRI
ncbi:MAG: hypothetical protein LBU64_08555 [Planctomycetota bacterium]|jgi:hypothetical protein|nr:hypothetical protein [Planctomycetota bacterium]